jgi:8-oxo-dGTP diphosphatase
MAVTEKGFIVPDGVTADMIVFTIIEGDTKVVLIDRKNAPLGLAIPGGFLDEAETLEACAIREFFEECSVQLSEQEILQSKTYSKPDRDPRQRIVSTAFFAFVSPERLEGLKAQDDALSVALYDFADLLADEHNFAFGDHKIMIYDAFIQADKEREWQKQGTIPTT